MWFKMIRHKDAGISGVTGMFGNKIKIEDDLYEKVKKCSAAAGYASVDEFVAHVLEKEVGKILGPGDRDPEEEVRKRLQGLGYIE